MSTPRVLRSVLSFMVPTALLVVSEHYLVHDSWQRAGLTAVVTTLAAAGVPLLLAVLAVRRHRRRDAEGGGSGDGGEGGGGLGR